MPYISHLNAESWIILGFDVKRGFASALIQVKHEKLSLNFVVA